MGKKWILYKVRSNPSTLTAGVNIEPASASGFYTFTASLYANPGQWDVNFGQRPFAHSVPTGFKPLNTDNIPINTPSVIRPQKHFDTLLYTGNASSNNRVTGLQFKPDLVWIKSRTTTDNHILQDTVRGNFILYPNLTNGDCASGGGWVKSFNHDGFTTDVNGPINTNGHNYAKLGVGKQVVQQYQTLMEVLHHQFLLIKKLVFLL